nr:(Fe-S)-binding protein [Candidatus Njordarchaeota archaeon]
MEFPPRAEWILYAGCWASYRVPESAWCTAKILEKIELDFTVLGKDERCCGMPFVETGEEEKAAKLALTNLKAARERGSTKILTICPGCYHSLKLALPKFITEEMEVHHVSSFLHDKIARGEIELDKPMEGKITYHDPCKLARYYNIVEEPRSILKTIKGTQFVELQHSGLDARCCGRVYEKELAELTLAMSRERMEEAASAKAQTIATSCPICARNLLIGAQSAKRNITVYDLPVLVAKLAGYI